MTDISIDVISDVVCPWCYIGKRRLENALAELPDTIGVSISWRPFQLDPTLPKEGRDRRAYMEAKFGSADRVRQAHDTITEAGAAEDIAFDFDAIEIAPNTLDAHRLIRWAASAGGDTQQQIVETLFRMYFTEGRNTGDTAVLIDAARQCGMDAAIAETLLHGDADSAAVRDEIATAQRMGVTGVPCFVLDGRYALVGAQPATTILRAMSEIASTGKLS